MSYVDYEPLYESNLRREQETKKWDVFRDPPKKVATGSMMQTKWIDFGEKFGKVVALIVTFCVVLGCAVISKGTLLFMTSQLNFTQRPYCNKGIDPHRRFMVSSTTEQTVLWTWMIFFTYCTPQVGTFLRSLRKILYKSWTKPTKTEFWMVFVTESLPTIGTAILVFAILPHLDAVRGIMLTNAMCFVPAVLCILSHPNPFSKNSSDSEDKDPNIHLNLILSILCVIAQASAFFIWPAMQENNDSESLNSLWLTPIAGILISAAWWENYVSDQSEIAFIRVLAESKKKFENSRYYIYTFVSLWKCILFMIIMLMSIEFGDIGVDAAQLFHKFGASFQSQLFNITEVPPTIAHFEKVNSTGGVFEEYTDALTPLWVYLINILSTYACYGFGKFACKIHIQGFSYAFPVNLAVPVGISILVVMCGQYNNDECAFYHTIPQYLFFKCPNMNELTNFLGDEHLWLWVIWLLSQVWITIHIWSPTSEKMASTERLFVRPMFDPFLIDQDLAMNRRRHDKLIVKEEEEEDDDDDELSPDDFEFKDDKDSTDKMTRIYACGTMWHETKEEMMEFLKSVMRMDEDQCARRIVKEYLEFNIPDYYELETHVFFDDAFLRVSNDDNDPQINDFVRTLVEAIDDAASEVHETRIRVRPPKKYLTPYGGRLVWTLPGRTQLIAHLKDKKKIRAKKRWSQVMYMYYLLGHKLMERNDLTPSRKQNRAENTFLLALDGDIDFQPKAVHLLVDLMKKNKTLGAACGRIHPIGSGPMVWYQMFEYAVGHWLQKATEHVIGCVLCSPGCFSLFRGKALMEDNVMKKYTTRSSEARHYVQYDQGEDRWLCTLLLQKGYRVEYSAASDAYTHCPEGFNEFYNQRRRWMPSTTANILDLLMNYKSTVSVNDNISMLYILYQGVLMVGTVLGAGTIFLMLVGAFVAAFQLDQWTSFMWNIVPILLFIVTCAIFTDDKIQLFVAGILSMFYCLIMMAVLVGVALQINNDGFLAPSSLFFFCVAAEMIIAGIIHPKEFNCLPYGIVYYITVPSMYMLLVIYSVFNMNNVSWGTREVTIVKKPTEDPAAAGNTAPSVDNKKPKNKIMSFLGAKNDETSGAFELSIASFCKCLWCTHKDTTEEEKVKNVTSKLDLVLMKLEKLERGDVPIEEPPSRRRTTMLAGPKMEQQLDLNMSDTQSTTETISEDGPENTWLNDDVLQRGEVDFLSTPETDFWHGVLEKYLVPVDDTNEKARITQNLKDLRDKAVLAFFMINALFVLIVFLLTLRKDEIHIRWPLEVKINFTYIEDINQIHVYKDYLQLEPIGMVFLTFFASLLIVQFFGMLIHRFETFSQIVSNTTLSLFSNKVAAQNLTQEEILEMEAVEVAKKLQKLKGVDSDDEDKVEERPERRKTVHTLAKMGRKQYQATSDLEKAFKRRLGKFSKEDYKGPVRRDTVAAIQMRKSRIERQTVAQIRRPTFARTNTGYIEDEYTV